LAIVATRNESQDCQRDHDGDDASHHTDILVRRQAGVKESDANDRNQMPSPHRYQVITHSMFSGHPSFAGDRRQRFAAPLHLDSS
jgi:hypothetical protein